MQRKHFVFFYIFHLARSFEIIISSVVMGTKVVAEYSTRMFLAMVQVPRLESVFGNKV